MYAPAMNGIKTYFSNVNFITKILFDAMVNIGTHFNFVRNGLLEIVCI